MPLNLSQSDRGGVWNERQEKLYRITNAVFYEISPDGVRTPLNGSALIPGGRQCSLPYSFNTQAIIGGDHFYLYDPMNGFRQVTDSDVGEPIDGVWVDGYYMLTDGESLYHTELTNESSISPLDFATSEYSPDPTVGLGLTPDNKVAAFNRYTTEFFINQANTNFAFTRLPGRNIQAGIVGTHAKVNIDGLFYILGGPKEGDVSVYRIGTGVKESLATRTVNKIIGQYTEEELADTVLETREIDNYSYLVIHLPNEVLLFNLMVAQAVGIEMAWSLLVSDEEKLPYRGINAAFDPRLAKWTVGDKYEDKIGLLDMESATHYDVLAECEVNTPFIYLETMSIDEINIETIPGFTNTDDATVMLSLTYDGVTHGMEVPMEYGSPSDYIQRFIKHRIGYIRNWFAFRFRWVSRSRMAFGLAKITFS